MLYDRSQRLKIVYFRNFTIRELVVVLRFAAIFANSDPLAAPYSGGHAFGPRKLVSPAYRVLPALLAVGEIVVK